MINPYKGKEGNLVRKISNSFYKIYFSDNIKRRLILGSSPARRGTAITGIPFEDMNRLQELTGLDIILKIIMLARLLRIFYMKL